MRSLFLILLIPALVQADPCGMVPPIATGDGPPITRIGLQKTWLCFRDGICSLAIRPGFEGRVDTFGMLIPFPTPPAIRKLPDTIFDQIAAAIDPPEVVVDLHDFGFGGGAVFSFGDADEGGALAFDEVEVLNQEAVGMYEVAVLAAGSAEALARWMRDHGYVYPEGMDGVCDEYVAEGWCFVAVKARVGDKAAADPAPGMREADPSLPADATFDGYVQALGFRFRCESLEVPMRLSAFNEGEMHNVVYVLADEALKIDGIDERLVVRQLTGAALRANLCEARPVRIVGGGLEDVTLGRLRELIDEVDPDPVNGVARELIAADLAALEQDGLILPDERAAKELANIGERLGLRGEAIDALHEVELEAQKVASGSAALARLDGMVLTVIDGDFPRELLQRENLTFSPFAMPAERNTRAWYDAVAFGPGAEPEGVLLEADALRALLDELAGLLEPRQR